MHFEFEIVTLPKRLDGYHPCAFTEGVLSVVKDEVCAWTADDMLLIEFAATLRSWLQHVATGGPRTLHYSSMNYEEEPVLAFVWHPAAERYDVASHLVDSERLEIQHLALVAAGHRFLDQLGRELWTSCGLALGPVLSRGEA